jgi:hypothetical protein
MSHLDVARLITQKHDSRLRRTPLFKGPLWVGDLLAGLIGISIALVFSWGPGIRQTFGLVEEFSFYSGFEKGLITKNPLLAATQNRRFIMAPYLLGHWLTPASFNGLIAVQILIALALGLSVYVLLRSFSIPYLPRIVAAIIAALPPADTGTFVVRDLPHRLSVALLVIGMCFLIRPIGTQVSNRSLFVAAACFFCALMTIELCVLVVVALPFYISRRDPNCARVRKLRIVIWGSTTLPLLLFVKNAIGPVSYQVALLDSGPKGFDRIIFGLGSLMYLSFWNVFGSWLEAFSNSFAEAGLFRIAEVAFVVALAIGGGLRRYSSHEVPPHGVPPQTAQTIEPLNKARSRDLGTPWQWPLGDLYILGVGLVILGLVPFAALISYATETERTQFLASVGSGSLIAATLAIFRKTPHKRLGMVLSMTLSAAVIIGALSQGAHYRRVGLQRAQVVRDLLTQVTEQAGPLKPHSTIAVYDEFRRFAATHWRFGASERHFTDALQWLYDDPTISAIICYPNDEQFGPYKDGCKLGVSGVQTVGQRGIGPTVPYPSIAFLRWGKDGVVSRLTNLDSLGIRKNLRPRTEDFTNPRVIAARRGLRPDTRLEIGVTSTAKTSESDFSVETMGENLQLQPDGEALLIADQGSVPLTIPSGRYYKVEILVNQHDQSKLKGAKVKINNFLIPGVANGRSLSAVIDASCFAGASSIDSKDASAPRKANVGLKIEYRAPSPAAELAEDMTQQEIRQLSFPRLDHLSLHTVAATQASSRFTSCHE